MTDALPPVTGLMLAGPATPAGEVTVTAPWDGAELATLPTGGAAHVDAALAVAHALHRDRRQWLPLPERIAILERTAALMRAQADALAVEAARDGGKPLVDSRVEVHRAIDGVALCVETIKAEHGDVVPMGMAPSSSHRVAFTAREPIGVVAAVSAFNHPLNLIVHQVAAAVAAGCPVIVKPADDTPLSCLRFVSLLREAGLPNGWCQVLIANSLAVAEALVTDARVAFFSFIGSARVGWMLRSKLAPGTRCALEHGGAAPVIVAADADETLTLDALTKGGFYHAGQVCVSVQRVFAPRASARDFAAALAARAGTLTIGDPTRADTDVGPLIRHAEVKRVHDWVREALDGGAESLSGAQPVSDSCYACTVLLDPPEAARVSQQEVFGPVVCVYGYDAIDEAIARANQLDVAFQAAVFTASLDTALHAWRQLDGSAVMVNDHTAFRIDGMPFAGLRHSGLGVGGIGHTIRDMQIDKMLVMRSSAL
ncbi:MAG: aldehyde dehydrogenase family protein [Pseudomonadota bacterium]